MNHQKSTPLQRPAKTAQPPVRIVRRLYSTPLRVWYTWPTRATPLHRTLDGLHPPACGGRTPLNTPLCQTLDGGQNISLKNKNTCGSPSCMTATLLRGGVVCSSFRQPPCRDRWTRSADPPARIAKFYPPSLICRIRVVVLQ